MICALVQHALQYNKSGRLNYTAWHNTHQTHKVQSNDGTVVTMSQISSEDSLSDSNSCEIEQTTQHFLSSAYLLQMRVYHADHSKSAT